PIQDRDAYVLHVCCGMTSDFSRVRFVHSVRMEMSVKEGILDSTRNGVTPKFSSPAPPAQRTPAFHAPALPADSVANNAPNPQSPRANSVSAKPRVSQKRQV